MSKEEEAPKYQLEDILNKKKPPPQILDLHGIKFVKTVPIFSGTFFLLISGLKLKKSSEKR